MFVVNFRDILVMISVLAAFWRKFSDVIWYFTGVRQFDNFTVLFLHGISKTIDEFQFTCSYG